MRKYKLISALAEDCLLYTSIIFVKSETAGSSIDIDGTITTRQLTETEAASLFPNLTVTAHAVFRVDDTVSDSNKELIGFEGKIENAKVVISTTCLLYTSRCV